MKSLFKINKRKYFLKIQLSIFLHVTTCLSSNERKQACSWKLRWTFELSEKETILSTKFHIQKRSCSM